MSTQSVSTTRQSYDLGKYLCSNQHHDLLHHVLMNELPYPGIALEFGVGSGDSLRCIARYMSVIGFDSFEGLPEDWRPGFDKGAFAYDLEEVRGNIPPHCALVPGLFEDTVVNMDAIVGGVPVALVHIDCDLYSSTKTVLDAVEPFLRPDGPTLPPGWPSGHATGTVLVFDEWWGYPGCEQHEQRAWKEFAERTGIQWRVIGHGHQAWGIEIV